MKNWTQPWWENQDITTPLLGEQLEKNMEININPSAVCYFSVNSQMLQYTWMSACSNRVDYHSKTDGSRGQRPLQRATGGRIFRVLYRPGGRMSSVSRDAAVGTITLQWMLFLRPSIANVLFRPTSAILAALQTTQQNNNPYPSWQHCRQHNRTIILTNNYIKRERVCVCVYI